MFRLVLFGSALLLASCAGPALTAAPASVSQPAAPKASAAVSQPVRFISLNSANFAPLFIALDKGISGRRVSTSHGSRLALA